MRHVTPLLAATVLSACATAPDAVAPRDVDYHPLLSLSCAELDQRAAGRNLQLQDYVDSQKRARIGDFFVPTSRLFGKNGRNVEHIAELRGELQAIDQARTQKRCAASPTT